MTSVNNSKMTQFSQKDYLIEGTTQGGGEFEESKREGDSQDGSL